MTAAVARNSPRLPGKLTGQIGRGKGGKKAQREWGTSATDLFNKALVSNKPICKRGGEGGFITESAEGCRKRVDGDPYAINQGQWKLRPPNQQNSISSSGDDDKFQDSFRIHFKPFRLEREPRRPLVKRSNIKKGSQVELIPLKLESD